ncbi:hypothetical protein [Chamaesiphon minutus]|uniref:C-terminal of Roc COR-B domain-containing protein n=1 Tax=Chamaesiphon minutus (strain ATCC 27169 / PCC 6605) TaxID=1173020 RepID=K9UNV6_CHAP6|nr:hypothetical protein [Chamaesiphon minutus]AFY96510.1 hypothetical protein Cha6605_5642 [Chamaesiphon minutus PCC 6605]
MLLENNTRAEVIEHYHQRYITVKIVGDRPRDLMTLIHRKFREIHEDFKIPADAYETRIPCNCQTCKSSSKPFDFPLSLLHQRIDRGKSTIECHPSGEDVNVRGLIDNILNDDRFDNRGMERNLDFDRRSDLDRLESSNRSPNINVSVTVPIDNHNQQDSSMTQDKNYNWTGDRIDGDKVIGDKVAGNKMQIIEKSYSESYLYKE